MPEILIQLDAGERSEELLRLLAKDVAELELGTVGFRHAPDVSGQGKSALGPVEWVGVALASGQLLRELIRVAIEWSQRARRPLRVRIGDDELELDDATTAQQDALVEAFIARHGKD